MSGDDADAIAARRIVVRGMVQGVGFRPFVHRIATGHELAGWVLNDGDGVLVHVEGPTSDLDAFERRLRTGPPPAARVDEVAVEGAETEGASGFVIRRSRSAGAPTTRIGPDLCICADCARELRDPADRRHAYAYLNCTNCGPRWSIIRGLPYDRPRTTMADWPLCADCGREYDDPLDRRFHAQPVACPACGPDVVLETPGGDPGSYPRGAAAVDDAARRLREGWILAVKGIGGYHLACDATSEEAVARLRERKFRKEKPFAVMASSLERARGLARLARAHEDLLLGPARPIVLAPRGAEAPVAEGVAPGLDELGLMLPSTPLHLMLFDVGAPDPLVLTSANRSNEPIAYEDDEARERLTGIADAFLVGERPIARRVDDSVVTVRRGRPFMVRRARGLAPASVARLETPRPILAVGADLKNAVALAAHGEVIVLQHVGDLADLGCARAFTEAIDDVLAMYELEVGEVVVAHDAHPGYVSTRHARSLAAAAHVAVPHHRAHVAAVLLEHGRPADEIVVGLALDGTGYDEDGDGPLVRGGEVFAGSRAGGLVRVDGLAPVAMPGGDAAARHPVQAAAAFLPGAAPAILEAAPFGFPLRFRQAQALAARGLRSLPSTSTGRLFDAAAATCGFVREITHEAQAATALEQLARRALAAGADAPQLPAVLDGRVLIGGLVELGRAGVPAPARALAFHRALAAALVRAARAAAAAAGARTVVVSGGVWHNAVLLDLVVDALDAGDADAPPLEVLLPCAVPANDGGIALGQVALAADLARR